MRRGETVAVLNAIIILKVFSLGKIVFSFGNLCITTDAVP
jgi:hypothetical protein